MKTSQHGIILIEGREGIRLTVYRDSKGIPTVGVGHVCLPEDNLKVGDKITHAQCDAFLAHDLAKAEAAVNTIKAPLTQNQFDALVSFTVNIGTDGFKKSSVAKYLNARNYATAAEALMNWVKPPEIKGRRRSEQKQFLTPDPISESLSPSPSPNPPGITDAKQTPDPPVTGTPSDNTIQVGETIVNAGGEIPKPPPDKEPVNVPIQKVSWTTKIVSLGTAVAGGLTYVKTNFDAAFDKAIGAVDGKLILYVLTSVGLIALGIWLYDRSAQRAAVKTGQLIDAASDTSKNTVTLSDK